MMFITEAHRSLFSGLFSRFSLARAHISFEWLMVNAHTVARGRTSQEMRRTINAALAPPSQEMCRMINAALAPPEKKGHMGARSISARAARVNPTTGRAVPADPNLYPGPLIVAKINDARITSARSAGRQFHTAGRRSAARPASENPKRVAHEALARARPKDTRGSWEVALLAQVEEAATAMRKTRSKAHGKAGVHMAARAAWAAVEAGAKESWEESESDMLEEGSEVGSEEIGWSGEEEEEERGEEEDGEEDGEEGAEPPAGRRPQSEPRSGEPPPAIGGTATGTLWQEPGPAAVRGRPAQEQKPPRVPKQAAGARPAAEGGELERRAESYWGCGGTAPLKAAAELEAGCGVPVPRPIRQLQLLTAQHLEELQRAVRKQRARELFSDRRWWYKPVMRRGARYFVLKAAP